MPAAARKAALDAGLEAYGRGDFFKAHELLEPAWMGTRDLVERELLQGLIKLAAAFVHDARGNPAGIAKNLRGAHAKVEAGTRAGKALEIDVVELEAAIRVRLTTFDTDQSGAARDQPAIPILRLRSGT